MVLLCRFVDALAGKKAKLADAALLNQAGKFIRYSKGDWTFKGINITTPPSNSDGWASFNITNLPGAATYPVATVSLIFANQDLSERGKPLAKPWSLFWPRMYGWPTIISLSLAAPHDDVFVRPPLAMTSITQWDDVAGHLCHVCRYV